MPQRTTVTIARAPGAARITAVHNGPLALLLAGDGPWQLGAADWAMLQRLAPGAFVEDTTTTTAASHSGGKQRRR